ncbi:hypothetical protein ACCS78_37315, partial [Rhizobium johnstonii]
TRILGDKFRDGYRCLIKRSERSSVKGDLSLVFRGELGGTFPMGLFVGAVPHQVEEMEILLGELMMRRLPPIETRHIRVARIELLPNIVLVATQTASPFDIIFRHVNTKTALALQVKEPLPHMSNIRLIKYMGRNAATNEAAYHRGITRVIGSKWHCFAGRGDRVSTGVEFAKGMVCVVASGREKSKMSLADNPIPFGA